LISARSLVRSQEGPPAGPRGCSSVGEHLLCKQGVAGSNPVISTKRRIDDKSCESYSLRSLKTEYGDLECSQAMFSTVCGQATKGERWMPWRREATKDVASCDKPRGAASRHRSEDVRMGEPGWGNAHSSATESIGRGTRTGGTETSQYLEGKEIKRDCPSSGERTGKSLNRGRVIGLGVAGRSRGKLGELQNQAIVEGSGTSCHRR